MGPLKDPEKDSFSYNYNTSEDTDIGYCRNCGHGMSVGYKYCPACGTRFQGDGGSTNPVVRMPFVEDEANPFARDSHAFAALTTHKDSSIEDSSRENADESARSVEHG